MEAIKMVEVTQEDANNYCEVLRALGMEEEGDPVAEVKRMDEELNIVHEALTELYNLDACVPVIRHALDRIATLKAPNAEITGCTLAQNEADGA